MRSVEGPVTRQHVVGLGAQALPEPGTGEGHAPQEPRQAGGGGVEAGAQQGDHLVPHLLVAQRTVGEQRGEQVERVVGGLAPQVIDLLVDDGAQRIEIGAHARPPSDRQRVGDLPVGR